MPCTLHQTRGFLSFYLLFLHFDLFFDTTIQWLWLEPISVTQLEPIVTFGVVNSQFASKNASVNQLISNIEQFELQLWRWASFIFVAFAALTLDCPSETWCLPLRTGNLLYGTVTPQTRQAEEIFFLALDFKTKHKKLTAALPGSRYSSAKFLGDDMCLCS